MTSSHPLQPLASALLLVLFALITVGCDEFLDEEGSPYDETIEDYCERYCARAIDCGDLEDDAEPICVQECSDRTHSFRRTHSNQCVEAELDAVDCEVRLSCEEVTDAGAHCGAAFQAADDACES